MTIFNLKKSVMTSLWWRYHYFITKNLTKLKSQDFSILGSSQLKFLATPVRVRKTVIPELKFNEFASVTFSLLFNHLVNDIIA